MIKQLIKNSISEVLLSFSVQRSQIESMMKLDFKIGDERANMMQLCFSNLAAWPLLFLLVILYFDPTKHSWSLQSIFQNNDLTFWLLDGRFPNMTLFFAAFFFLQWIFRQESFLIAVLFYFLLKSDIHFHLALSGISAIVFSRSCYLWWMHTDLQNKARAIWIEFTGMQLAGWVVSTALILYVVDQLQFNHYFSESMTGNRFEMTLLALVGIYLFQFLLSSVWGHFKFKQPKEPTEFPIHYSTAHWILRFRMRPYFKKQIKDQTEKYLALHQQNLEELRSIKDLSPVSIPFQISQVLQTEINHLKLASSRLTID